MATYGARPRDVIICDLCDKPTKQFCNSCQVSLCDVCTSKHRNEFQSLSHEIVPFLARKIQLAFPECQEHPGQRCEAHCQQCLKPVCIKCFLESHKGHDAEELIKTHEHRIQEIQNDTIEIDKIIPRYQKEDDDIEFNISKTIVEFEDFEKDIKNQRQLWHHEVDNIFDNIDLLCQFLKEKNLDALQIHQKNIKILISEMIKDVQQNNRIMKSNKFSEVSSFHLKPKEYRDSPPQVDFKMPSLYKKINQGREISIALGDFKATLTQTSSPSLETGVFDLTTGPAKLMNEATVITVKVSCDKHLFNIAFIGKAEVWISTDNETIIRVDINGSVKDTFITQTLGSKLLWNLTGKHDLFPYMPLDFSVTKMGDLIYLDRLLQTVIIVRDGRKRSLLAFPESRKIFGLDWVPLNLCCTKSGDLLLHMMGTSFLKVKHGIFRYNGQREEEVIFLKSADRLRTMYMTENSNGDVCVTAPDAKNVIVFDRTGEVRFQYEGTMTMRKESFNPRGIVTDSLYQIIVSDHNNDCLHILDQNGQFLKFIEGYGLSKPYGLSIDSMDRLWVGLYDSGEIKVIEYLKHTNLRALSINRVNSHHSID